MTNTHRSLITNTYMRRSCIVTLLLGASVSMANSTSVEVIHDLGVQAINGDGVSVDLEKGRYYIHQSALQGYPLGQFHLGVLFYTGDGGIQNTACAKWWLEKASRVKGEVHDMAQDVLDEIREESAVLSLGPVAPVEPVDEKLCQQLPYLISENNPLSDVELEPKINLDKLQNGIISVPKLSTIVKTMGQYQLPSKLESIPRLNYVLRWSDNLYNTFLKSWSKGWDLLLQCIQYNQEKEIETAVYKFRASQTWPLDIVRNPPEEPEEITITILLPPEHEIEQGNDASNESLMVERNLFIESPEHIISKRTENVLANTQKSIATESEVNQPSTDRVDVASLNPDNIEQNTPVLPEMMVKKDVVELPSSMIPPEKTVLAEKKTPKQTALSPNLGGELHSASPLHYTLQLGSASTSAGLYEQARRHKLSNYLVYETVRNGRQWYVLVYGEYPNMTSAKRALKNLPPAILRDKPWIRSLQHVQSEL